MGWFDPNAGAGKLDSKIKNRIIWGVPVVLLGALIAIAIPRYEAMVAIEKKNAWKFGVGEITSAASIYYGDSNGIWPPALDVLVPKYLESIPKDPTGSQKVVAVYDGTGGWVYNKLNGKVGLNFPTPTP